MDGVHNDGIGLGIEVGSTLYHDVVWCGVVWWGKPPRSDPYNHIQYSTIFSESVEESSVFKVMLVNHMMSQINI